MAWLGFELARLTQGMGGGGQCDLKPEQTAWRFCGSSSAPLSLGAGSLWAGVLLGHVASSSAGPHLPIKRGILKVMTSPLCGPSGSSSAPLSLGAGSLWADVLLGHVASSSAGPHLPIKRGILKVMTSPLCGPRNLTFSGKCCEGLRR